MADPHQLALGSNSQYGFPQGQAKHPASIPAFPQRGKEPYQSLVVCLCSFPPLGEGWDGGWMFCTAASGQGHIENCWVLDPEVDDLLALVTQHG